MGYNVEDPAIYSITNRIDNKMYIGYAFNYRDRWLKHKSFLRRNEHYNSHLQSAWNKYGEGSFKFERIEICEVRELKRREHYWCDLMNVIDDKYGYNIRPTDPNGKVLVSQETRKKQSDMRMGIKRQMFQLTQDNQLVKVWIGIDEIMTHYKISRELMYALRNQRKRSSKVKELFEYKWLNKRQYQLIIKK